MDPDKIKRDGSSIMTVVEKTRDILFDKFFIIECYKKDDHSSVYLAEDNKNHKKVILKILNTLNLPDQSILQRFKREAKVLLNIDHPNIIKVLDFGTYDNFFYTSFEYFESKNLRHFIRENSLSPGDKQNLIVQLYTGIGFAHKNNIIHRDIKPENILVSKKLELKIVDFGLALSMNDNFVTSQFHIVGTPTYMSPEQICGEKLTTQSDLFSAGIVTYELYTGINPFLGNDVNETLNNIINFEEEKLSALTSRLPDDIVNLVIGLLQKEPSKRIDSAETALKILMNSKGEIKYNAMSRRIMRRKILIVPSVLFLFIMIFIARFYYNRVTISPQQTFQPESKPPVTMSGEQIKNNPPVKEKEVKKEDIKPVVIVPPAVDKNLSAENTSNNLRNNVIKRTGSLFVECLPWAYVYVDSLKIDITPLKNNITLEEGEHLIRLYNPNYPAYSRKIVISGSSLTNMKINLDTLFGYFDCKVFPWCEIYIDGKLKGQTPLQSPVRLIPGEHHIILKNPDFTPVEYKVKINQNQTYSMKYNFKNVN
jgi:serine/threonine-protein kinase